MDVTPRRMFELLEPLCHVAFFSERPNEALAALAAANAQAAELVKLRYFAGLSIPEAAEVLNISPRSADRLWAYARAWLRRAISGP